MTPEEIAQYFREMEEYLFKSMSRNLSRHEAWEAEEGFEWVQWQAEQINGLRAFREEVMDIVNATYDKATPEMERLLKDAYHEAEERAQIDLSKSSKHTYRQQFFGTPPKMRSLVETLLNDVSETRYAVINRMNNGMLGIIQRADLFAQSGTMTLQQAVDMAAKDFVSAGLNCVEYSNGARVGIDSYLEMALRTSARDAAMIAEGTKRQEWGEFLVVSNVINTTCPACMKWQGKVLIDDVNSNGKPDGKHIRLSVAKANGFLHPNCRHKPYTYIEGVTPIPNKPDKAKTKEQYEAEQKQRYYERNIRKYKRLRDCAVDPANKEKYEAKVKEWSKALDEHLNANPQLRKNSWRTSGRGTATRTDAPKVTPIESKLTEPLVTPAPLVETKIEQPDIKFIDPKDIVIERLYDAEKAEEYGETIKRYNEIRDNIITGKGTIAEYGDEYNQLKARKEELEQIRREDDQRFRDALNKAREVTEEEIDSVILYEDSLLKEEIRSLGSIEDVEEYMKSKDWFKTETYYNGETVRSSDYLTLKGCDLDNAKTICSSYDEFFEKFPQLKGKINAPHVGRTSQMCLAETKVGFVGSGEVTFNIGYFKNRRNLVKELIKSVKTGYHPLGSSGVRSVVLHELGHSIDCVLSYDELLFGMTSKTKAKMLSSIIQPKALKTLKIEKNDISEYLSTYGTSDKLEFLAEAFAEYMCSSKPRPLATEVGKLIEKYIGESL